MTRISTLARKRARINPLGVFRRRRGLIVVGALLAAATVFGVGTASADPLEPPLNTSLPTISGSTNARETLTADPGSWSGNTAGGFSYQWQRCNAAGASCDPISGATNSTYTTNDGDWASTIVVEVTALDGPAVATSAATAVLGYPAPYGGDCSLVPNYGEAFWTVFSISCQNWSDYTQQTPLTYTFQWWGCDADGDNCVLEHENAPTWVPRGEGMLSGFLNGDTEGGYPGSEGRGKVVICQHNGGCTTWEGNIYLGDGLGAPHVNPLALPTISGDAWIGETLSAGPGEWTGDPTISYQWLRCASTQFHGWWEMWQMYDDCYAIADATETTYTVQPSDFGSRIMVEVSATDGGGTAVVVSAATSYVVDGPPPVNTSPPTISGNAYAREILTADPGSWSGQTSGGFSYQWQRCNAAGAICNPISGATNPTYATQDSEIGATIAVEVTALDGPTVATSAATAALGYPAPYGGNCQLVPLVGAADSDVFTVTCDSWSDYHQQNPLTYSVETWGCDEVGANCSLEYATRPSVVPRVEFVISGFSHGPGGGEDRVVMVICQHLGGCTRWTGTAYVSDDGRPHSNPAAPPTVNGDVWLGETLTADPGEWSGNPTIDSYQWLRCPETPGYEHWQRYYSGALIGCEPIAGATGMSYTVQPEDRGWAFAVEVTATNAQGQTAITGPTTRRAVHAAPTNIARPTVTDDTGGQLVSGDILSTNGGQWTGDVAGFSYQWQRCDSDGLNCQPIAGATDPMSYTLQPSDIGSTIVMAVTASNSDGLTTHASSLATESVDPSAPSNTVQPQIDTSSPLIGTQVSASTGTWTGAPAPADGDFSYQWYRCGDSCTLIGDATASTYTPADEDFGSQLAVVVTASTDGGSASSSLNNAVLTDPVAHVDVFLSIDSGPNDLADSDSATFSFSSPQEPSVDFECFLDEVDMGSCSSPVSYTDLAEGEHSFSVHAIDFLGLESVNTADPVWEWTVDTTAPVATIASAPSGSTSATVASFGFHTDDPAATFECKLDAGSWTPCASPQSYNSLTLGGHSFRVRATDAAANVSAPISATWTVIAAPSNDPTPEPTTNPMPKPTPTLTVIPARPTETSTPRSTKPGALPPVTAPEFSTSATVQLVIAAPAGANQIVISNQPDFTGARSFPVSADGLYTWTLLSAGTANGERTVYVRFVTPDGISGTLTSNVKLDDKAPVLSKPRFVGKKKSRVQVSVPASDPGSGLSYIQFAPNTKRPWGWTSYTSKPSIRTAQTFIWVRTADAAGNVSGWQRIAFPKAALEHKHG